MYKHCLYIIQPAVTDWLNTKQWIKAIRIAITLCQSHIFYVFLIPPKSACKHYWNTAAGHRQRGIYKNTLRALVERYLVLVR